jgi:RNA 2',3'-cyclic 3'-phosphodiesterase
MRLFLGIALADAVVRELEIVVARLRSGGSELRWTEPDSWHITLQFLGYTTPEQYECLTAQLGEVRSEPVSVQLGSLDCFERAGVFFADVAATQGLATLAERVLAATDRCGFAAETRPFHPHITLARVKGQGREAELRALASRMRGEPAFTPFMAREFLLYESHLSAEGARHDVRGRFPLTVA